jgi:hypothetical protein
MAQVVEHKPQYHPPKKLTEKIYHLHKICDSRLGKNVSIKDNRKFNEI